MAEVTISNGSHVYTLAESFNAYIKLEALVGKSTAEVMMDAAAGSMTSVRALLWAFLQRHHGTDFPAVEAVGDLIEAVGLDTVQQQMNAVTAKDTPARQRLPRKTNRTN